jgi:hypothetical protein
MLGDILRRNRTRGFLSRAIEASGAYVVQPAMGAERSVMKAVRGIIAGVVWGIIAEVLGILVYGVLFAAWWDPTSPIWRPMSSLHWKLGMPLADLFGGLMAALGFAVLYKGIPGTGVRRGLIFGLILWFVCRVPGELYWYVMCPAPFMLVIAGWLHGLLLGILGGTAIAAVYGKSLEART